MNSGGRDLTQVRTRVLTGLQTARRPHRTGVPGADSVSTRGPSPITRDARRERLQDSGYDDPVPLLQDKRGEDDGDSEHGLEQAIGLHEDI